MSPKTLPPRPAVLVAVSSSCQLYSGTGTALFDWMRFARGALDFSLMVDSGDWANFAIANRVCREDGFGFLPSAPERMPGCPDFGQADAARVLRSRRWDYVECVSWANAATNLQVLANRPHGSHLIFTPHTQPLWTLPHPHRFFMTQNVFHTMLRTSDLVFTDTPKELAHIPPALMDPGRTAFLPLGVDTARFHPGSASRARRLLTVFDFREHRKRPDLMVQAFTALAEADPTLELAMAGKGSAEFPLPAGLEARVSRLGYLSDEALVEQYRSAGAFMLLSDFEAFGLPIVEALCCGTPVVTTRQEHTADIFGDLPGVVLVDNADAGAVRDAVLALLDAPPARAEIVAEAAERFGHQQTYARKLARVLALRRSTPAAA